MKGIWTEMTVKAFSSHLAEESLLPGSVNASAIVGGYAAALGVKAACRTYGEQAWEAVDPGQQTAGRLDGTGGTDVGAWQRDQGRDVGRSLHPDVGMMSPGS